MTPERVIVESAYALACSLPSSTVEAVATAILTCSEQSLRAEISKRVAHHQHRDMTVAFVDRWRNEAKELDAQRWPWRCKRRRCQNRPIVTRNRLNWCGPAPTPSKPHFVAQNRRYYKFWILQTAVSPLVSYAVYKIPRICEALVRAANRGVKINIIVETPNKIEGQTEYDTIQALGDQVACMCQPCITGPKKKEERIPGGKHGILHVKCAVADGRWLFLSSANLTEYAFTINMELGMLVTGGCHYQGRLRNSLTD